MSERVLLFRVADSTGYFYTENPSNVVLRLHDMRTHRAKPRTITIEPVVVSQDEADILIGEYYETPAGGGGRRE